MGCHTAYLKFLRGHLESTLPNVEGEAKWFEIEVALDCYTFAVLVLFKSDPNDEY